jgi:hypothetical protein
VPPTATFDDGFDVGDRVVTVDPVGPVLRWIPPRQCRPVVARQTEAANVVHFDTGRVEHVEPSRLNVEQGGD